MNFNGTLEPAEVQQTCNVHVPRVDLNGDYNRDGTPVDHPDETNAVTFAGPKGFTILVNANDSDGDGQPDADDSTINTNDLDDIFSFHVAKLGISSNVMVSNITATVELIDPETGNNSTAARIFHTRQTDTTGASILNFSNPTSAAIYLSGDGVAEFGIEGRRFGKEVIVRLKVKHGSTVLGQDEIRVLVSPYFVSSNCDITETVYSGAGPEPESWPVLHTELTNALHGVVDVEVIGSARFVQDDAEIGYTRLPQGMSTEKPVTVMDRGNSVFENMVNTNTFYFDFGSKHGGSIEGAPPTTAQPYGSIIVGSTNLVPTEAFFLNQAVQTVSSNLITLSTEWLAVGHADEVFTIVPTGAGFAVLVADLELAIDLLEQNPSDETTEGFISRADMLDAYAANSTKVAFIESRLAAVRTSLSEGLGIPESQFIKVPVAFSVLGWDLAAPKAKSFLPNSINMLVVKNSSGTRRLLLPDPFFEPFVYDLNAKLGAIGYVWQEVFWICTTEPHEAAGEVHCSTISRRFAP